jgi:hypothetical protein
MLIGRRTGMVLLLLLLLLLMVEATGRVMLSRSRMTCSRATMFCCVRF